MNIKNITRKKTEIMTNEMNHEQSLIQPSTQECNPGATGLIYSFMQNEPNLQNTQRRIMQNETNFTHNCSHILTRIRRLFVVFHNFLTKTYLTPGMIKAYINIHHRIRFSLHYMRETKICKTNPISTNERRETEKCKTNPIQSPSDERIKYAKRTQFQNFNNRASRICKTNPITINSFTHLLNYAKQTQFEKTAISACVTWTYKNFHPTIPFTLHAYTAPLTAMNS